MPAARRFRLLVLALAAAFGLSACGPFGLEVTPKATSVQRPSNVAVYMSVTDSGDPVTDLSINNFKLYEDGELVDPNQSQMTLLTRDVSAEHRTVLLVDLTGARSDSDRLAFSQATAAFVRRVRKTEGVAVFAFDGAATLHEVESFPQDPAVNEPSSVQKLEQIKSADSSRNLNGAVVQGLEKLDAALASGSKPVRVGTLVVFTSGPDLAGRVTWEQVNAELDRTRHSVIAISLGEQRKIALERLGRAGVIRAPTMVALNDAFDKAGARVVALNASHYLLSYCSPARGGVRELRIEVSKKNQNGGLLITSSKVAFSAEGFEAGCSARDVPRFIVTLVSSDFGTVPGIAPDSTPPPEPKPEAKPPETAGETKSAENKSEATTGEKPAAKSEAGKDAEDNSEGEKPAAKTAKKTGKSAAKKPAAKASAKKPAATQKPAEKPAVAEKPPAEKPPEKKPVEKKPAEKKPATEEPDFRP